MIVPQNVVARMFTVAAAIFAPLLFASVALAQTYPSRPITMIVPTPVGGATDNIGRLVAAGLTERLGVNVIVDNRGGASGAIGVEAVARAAPDGHTLLFTSQDFSILPLLRKSVPYNIEKDFVPLAKVTTLPLLIASNPKFPAKTLKELVDMAKAKPGFIKYAHGGTGTLLHFGGEMLEQQAGIDLLDIPYKGGGPAVAGVIAGDTELYLTGLNSAPYIKSGQLHGIAVAKATRSPILPQVPTGVESGFPNWIAEAWMAVLAPAGLPEPIAARLSKELTALASSPEFQQRLATIGGEPEALGREATAQFLSTYKQSWQNVISKSNVKLEN